MANTPPKKEKKKQMSIVIDEAQLRRIEITTDYPSTANCGRLVDHDDMMKMMMVDDDYDGDDNDDGDNNYDGDDNGDDVEQE